MSSTPTTGTNLVHFQVVVDNIGAGQTTLYVRSSRAIYDRVRYVFARGWYDTIASCNVPASLTPDGPLAWHDVHGGRIRCILPPASPRRRAAGAKAA